MKLRNNQESYSMTRKTITLTYDSDRNIKQINGLADLTLGELASLVREMRQYIKEFDAEIERHRNPIK